MFDIVLKTEVALQRWLKKRCSENMRQIYSRIPMLKYDFNDIWNHTSVWVFSRKFAAYFQNTFF